MAIPRNELKFYLNSAYVPMLFSRLSAAMPMDRHTRNGGNYRIRSLYFDDPSFSAYFDKINGFENRVKYRIRFYNSDLSYVRLEKKAKQDRLCFKDFEVISSEQAKSLLAADPSSGGALLQELWNKVHFERFRPLLFVDYCRSAFLHPAGNVRITLDRDICSSRFVSDLKDDLAPVPVLEEGMSVLEVKYDTFLPPYISSLLEDVPKIPCSVSKYCLCARALF
ncbi:MAG: polyphosphate polymerase domain-containing protein [Ruminococcaceae bacterium]|nr:polyphosphate polymerase domain-containing protein [Oscillospiraceae bacterium]